ncbi:MAG TPA: ParB N-terminal domain-containing protein [Kribbella sp.]|nr:ParB N-terminal domain-containing protein [Kribbella sp.]
MGGRTNGEGTGLPHIAVSANRPETQLVQIDLLRPADSPRRVGEDAEHIRMLAESDAVLPPILVHRATMRVIDGMHRVGAARLQGRRTIEATFFDGTEDEAFVLAVRANVAHGLPLSRADREAAAERIVASSPRWSDRAIAAATGLGATTVARIRQRLAPDGPEAAVRLGRDGRTRPLDGADGRLLASAVIAARPETSLREVAKVAGISPATARDVRERMRRGDDPVPPRQRTRRRRSESPRPREEREPTSVLESLRQDPSLRFAESGRALLRWLSGHTIDPDEWRGFVEATPPHSAFMVAGLARSYAKEWLDFASEIEERVRAREDGRQSS